MMEPEWVEREFQVIIRVRSRTGGSPITESGIKHQMEKKLAFGSLLDGLPSHGSITAEVTNVVEDTHLMKEKRR